MKKLLGFDRTANFKAIMRLFRKFNQATLMWVFGNLYRWFSDNLQVNHSTLDLDSTVMARYGQQEGAVRGYNPRKPGRCSHHPLMTFVADARMIANLWLRPGNSHSANNVLSLLEGRVIFSQYRYSAIVTDMDLPAQALWRLYRGRADCENRIKELKYDFGGKNLNLKDFWATEAALLTVMMACNLKKPVSSGDHEKRHCF